MTFRSTPYTPYDSSGWDDSSRPADSDELPQDVYRHAEVEMTPWTELGRPDLDEENEPETYAEAIGLDDYDILKDK